MSTRSLRLGICAGETSGDILAGSVLKAWRHAGTTIELSGIGGPETTALGLRSLAPMERLAVISRHLTEYGCYRTTEVDVSSGPRHFRVSAGNTLFRQNAQGSGEGA